MSEQTDKMNYCCDCGHAVKNGLFFKKWYCKNQDVIQLIDGDEFYPITKNTIAKKIVTCEKARETTRYFASNDFAPCKYFKETQANWLPLWPSPTPRKRHSFVPPKVTPTPNAPPRPNKAELNDIPLPERQDIDMIENNAFTDTLKELLAQLENVKKEMEKQQERIKELERENAELKHTTDKLMKKDLQEKADLKEKY